MSREKGTSDHRLITLTVGDMTCTQCERNVEAALLAVPGVAAAHANHRMGKVVIELANGVPRYRLVQAIRSAGYTPQDPNSGPSPATAVACVASALVLAIALSRLGFGSTMLPIIDDTSSLGIAGFALTGLLTSVHCVSMCGGLALMGSLDNGRDGRRVFAYNLGRLAGYTLVGALLGALGSRVALSIGLRAYVGVIAAAAMLVVGATLTGAFPGMSRVTLLLPSILRDRIAESGGGRSLVIGVANGLMPCGPLQAMQLAAIASGSAMAGATSLVAFCLGTMPLMMSFSLVARHLSSMRRKAASLAGGIVVMAMGTLMLATNLALVGIRLPLMSLGTREAIVITQGDTQVVRSTLAPNSYPNLRLKAGIPVRWEIEADASALNGCNGIIIMPEWDVYAPLEEGTNVIEFTPEEPGDFGYSCWMGMIRATVSVRS